MPTHNLRQGVIKIQSGDAVALVKTAAFTEGDFSFTRTKNTIQVKNRGKLDHLRKGDEEAITYSFSAKFVDKTLRRCLEEFIWDGTTENITGLTAQVNNPAEPTAYAYEQDSLATAAGDAIQTKVANGVAPSSDGEYGEDLKTRDDLEGVEMVGDAEAVVVVGGTFAVQPPVADTDVDIIYNAIGRSTLDPGTSDVKTFRIDLEKLDVALAAQGIVDETYQLNHCVVESVEQAEGDEFDTVSFSGFAYITKATIV